MSSEIKQSIELKVIDALTSLNSSKNLVANITNTVSQNLVANVELALGASPIMFYMPNEAREFVSIANSAYINLGTVIPIYEQTIPAMLVALKDKKLPWVLDPVAVGFGELRNKLFNQMPETKIFPSVIRGNASEIITLANLWGVTNNKLQRALGTDTINSTQEAENSAVLLARCINGIVAVSGEVDFVTDGQNAFYLQGGSYVMEKITGMGCSLGGAIASFLTVTSPLYAALSASILYKIAGEISLKASQGIGDFVANFINSLNKITETQILENKVLTNKNLSV